MEDKPKVLTVCRERKLMLPSSIYTLTLGALSLLTARQLLAVYCSYFPSERRQEYRWLLAWLLFFACVLLAGSRS